LLEVGQARSLKVIDMRKLTELKLIFTVAMVLFSTATVASVTYTWTADGITESVAQQATAVFNFSSRDSLTITLTNNVAPTTFITSEVDGLLFRLTSMPATATLESISAPSVINCTSGVTPCPPGTGSTPYGWGTTLSGLDFALGAGFSGGGFSYHPYGIVNQSYNGAGLSDPLFNPLLVGPVTFTFALTGLDFIPEVSSATFLFGRVPNGVDGRDPPSAVPEPQSLALLGLGLLAAAWTSHRKRRPV
jgi:PEP-CTERM motif